jgi:DNA-binding transcriptional LysR family regulator
MGTAAKRLNISQPAVCKAVVELEGALGVRLLDRGRRGVVPTAYGLALAKHSVTVFNDLRHGVQAIDLLSDPTGGEVRIGTTEPVATAIVLPAIDRVSRKYPQISFHVVPPMPVGLVTLKNRTLTPPRSAVHRECSRFNKAAGKIGIEAQPLAISPCAAPEAVCAELERTYIA